ncbi:MAG TPA: hypothetical protein VMF58_12620 [Rhizomicrobium sp.]|nr:hypothetical protein [Rhizomicrobium sp.]
MKSRVVLAISLIGPMLCGCSHWPFAGEGDDGGGIASSAHPLDAHCREIAQYRKDEASFQHEDDRSLERIYAFTYKTCAEWRAKHIKQEKN